jgi:membrane dipeptidase
VLSSPAWFDAHLDLAYLAECGRDMHADPADARGRHQPAAVTLASLVEGRVRAVLATIFTQAVTEGDDETGAHTYALGDAEAAHTAGHRQLKLYHAWRDAGIIELMPRRGAVGQASSLPSLLTGILMECADPIRSPDDLDWWADHGVVAIGMAWWHQSRYAGGNGVETGLTDLGRELIPRMDALGIVHDASHLSDASLSELFERTDAPVVATHSNSRAIMSGGAGTLPASGGGGILPASDLALQRHIPDEFIAEIARRGGIIGLNLYRRFIKPDLGATERPTIDDAIAHVEHVCEIAGHRHAVGLGSDMDGGLTANDLPDGIDRPADLVRLADALSARGWSDDDVRDFAWGNWARFWGIVTSD